MAPVRAGLSIPGMVPTVLEIPIRMAAYFGATSRWFTPNLNKKKKRIHVVQKQNFVA